MRSMEAQYITKENITDGSRCMATHQGSENVDMDTKMMPLIYSKAENGGNCAVTVMNNSEFTSRQISRQLSVPAKCQILGDSATWSEELLSSGMAISSELSEGEHLAAALVAVHFAQGRPVGLQDIQNIDKPSQQQLVAELPSLPTLSTLAALPPLKRAQDHVWFQPKNEVLDGDSFKNITDVNSVQLDKCEPDMSVSVQNKSNKKSLPHKKRISRRLKRTTPLPTAAAAGTTGTAGTHSHMLVVEGPPQDEEILPDNFVPVRSVEENPLAQQIRPSFICQICGDFYDADQLKFYQHLKHHYEPGGATIMIENSINQTDSNSNGLDLTKIDDTCTMVDNGAPLSLVELSIEGTVSGKPALFQSGEKEILYSSSDNAKELYLTSALNTEEPYEPAPPPPPALYSCPRCNKTFRKQKACEAHYKEIHTRGVDEMSEFSEPEDLMEGIHLMVETDEDYHDASDMPHLTVENGHVHQGHLIMRQWFMRNTEPNNTQTLSVSPHQIESPMSQLSEEVQTQTHVLHVACPLCSQVLPSEVYEQHALECHINLREEMLQRMIAVQDSEVGQPTAEPQHGDRHPDTDTDKTTGDAKMSEALASMSGEDGKKPKALPRKWFCGFAECGREFRYRNSLLYHALSHSGQKPYSCSDCDKSFYTTGSLKVHSRLHSGDKPYKCEDCGRNFRQWGDLKYHKASLHSTQKLHQCEYCGKEFARKYSLSVHRRIHTGEKNYKCEYCDKTFRASSYLLFHRRIHTGEKPHACAECNKCFRVKGDLRRHILTHDKQKLTGVDGKKKATKKARVVRKSNEKMEHKKSEITISTSSITPELVLITKEQASGESENKDRATITKPGRESLKVTKEETDECTTSSEDVAAMYVHTWPYGT